MRIIILSFLFPLFSLAGFTQCIELVNSGTSEGIAARNLNDTSIFFMSNSSEIACFQKNSQTINFFPSPHYSNGYNVGLQMMGDSIFFVSTVYQGYPYPFTLSKSTDYGQSWEILLDTICDKDLAGILVIDTDRLYLLGTIHPSLMTEDNGDTWFETNEVFDGYSMLRLHDSVIYNGGVGDMEFTFDKGSNWSFISLPFDNAVRGISVVNDTTFICQGNILSYCTDDTLNSNCWTMIQENVVVGWCFCPVSSNEIYVGGQDGNNHHRIARTTDLGNSWQVFDPGIDGEIYSITPINDSVFLVSGKYGSLYKWNKNQTQWGSLGLEEKTQQTVRIFPNPSGGVFHLESEMVFEISGVTDFTGRSVSYAFDSITGELVIEEPAGIYFVQLKQADGLAVFKLVVE